MKPRLQIIILFLSIILSAKAQTDTVFWFAVPYATRLHTNLTADLVLTATDLKNPTTITITQPKDPIMTPRTVVIDPSVSLTKTVHFTQSEVLEISSNAYNYYGNSALLVRSDREITAYYEINKTLNNPAIFTLKGQNALGSDFWTPFQKQWDNHGYAASDPDFSQIIIVATENNTKVTINFKTAANGYAAGVDHVIYLDKGETYMFVPVLAGGRPSKSKNARLIGTHITSPPDKPISVTLGDDSVEKGGWDYMGDQHIPTVNAKGKKVIGENYVIMKGKVSDQGGGNNEKAYVLVTEDNTTIRVTRNNGTFADNGPYNKGYQLEVNLLDADNFVHIHADKPVYVLHIAGFGTELGEAILPTIDGCTGSLSVSFVRSKSDTVPNPNPTNVLPNEFYLNLMTKKDARDSFYISINGGPPVHFLDSTYFQSAGSGWYVLKDPYKRFYDGRNPSVPILIPTGKVIRIFNTQNVFHLGYFNGKPTGGGCVYGYFSDYNELEASATVENMGGLYIVCGVDSIQLKAKGGLSYQWSPSKYLNDATAQNPIFRPPPEGFDGEFTVSINQPCYGPTPVSVHVTVLKSPYSFITVNQNDGCAPLPVNFNDASSGGTKFRLNLGDGTPLMVSNSPIKVSHDFNNTTDTVVKYNIVYTVGNADGCYTSYYDTISVYPQVTSDFELINPNDSSICNGTTIGLRNLSTGNTDTYQWDFGDGSSDTDTLVTHHYTNPGSNEVIYPVTLVANSPFGCRDTSAVINIHVYPYIYSSFTVDSSISCSPALFYINPSVSVGVDTFYWSFSDRLKAFIDNSYQRLNRNPFEFSHTNSTHPVPDTIQIAMQAANRFGCRDTATTRSIIVYPQVDADFTLEKDKICDSVDILVTNLSSGYNLFYEWDFGNGTSKTDTLSDPFFHYFFNRTSDDTVYTISLITTSDYICRDTATLPLTVYPFVSAGFSVDYLTNCSPLHAEIVNISKGGAQFDWDFGDGTVLSSINQDTLIHVYENNTDNDTTYYISLKTQNSHGCKDSLERSVMLFPRVIANFGFTSPDEGCNPLNVSFANNSKGRDLNYIWDFGDKTYSTSQNPPPRIYKNSADKDTTYYVNLTVMNLAGCDSGITKTVKVYSKVTADYSIERVDSCSPFRIKVDNFSSGGITDYIWKYTAQDSVTLHTNADPVIPVYHNTGLVPVQYPFVLKTRNSHGCTALKSDFITVFPEMHANFHPGAITGCEPLKVDLTNNSNLIAGTTFFWDFGDGRTSNLTSPANHVYNNLTNATVPHNIRLQATTQYGCFDDTTITVQVFPYIYAKFSIDKPAICSNELFAIDRNSSAGAIEHYYWNYGDGTGNHEKTDALFNHTYRNSGIADLNPQITLTVTNAQGCDTSWTETIPVHPQAVASFNVDNQEACYPLANTFSNFSQPAIPLTYYWDFGDGSSSAAISPVHHYKNYSRTDDKIFTVKLTTTTAFGCDSTIAKTILIHPKPFADFSFPKAVDCPPFEVQFTSSSLGSSLSYNWDFDNGHTSDQKDPSETFFNTGSDIAEKNVSLRVTTDFNCSDTLTKPVQIYPDVQVDFSASEWSGCSPMQINFDGTATNENEYYWYIDGKVFSNYEDPSYRLTNESSADRTYDIRFYAVSINGCSDDTVKKLTLFPKPLAEFLPDPQAQDYDTRDDITEVTLNNQTSNQAAWNYKWTYGDGSTSAETKASFVKKYMVWGDINNENRIPVTLVATNNNHPECSDTIMHYVIIKPPLPKIEIGADISGCMPLTVDFSASTKYIYPDSYHWDFGYNGVTSDESNPDPFVFDTAGMYIVRLTVSGDGGTNWDYKTIQVYPKPVINFDFDPKYAWLSSQTEPGTPIKFFNNTYNAEIFEWDFGDETGKNYEKQPQHEYKKAGEFYPELRAENQNGCFDVLKSTVPVIIEGHGFLEFPNAITIIPDSPADEDYDPNEPPSGHNLFRPLNQGVRRYKLEIYNRWGELVFESTDVNKGWNGFIKGQPVKQDVYVWRVTATFTNGQPYVAAGDVTVLVTQP